MLVARLIGWLLLVLAFFVLGRDIVVGYLNGDFTFMPIGQLWLALEPEGPAFVESSFEHFFLAGIWVEAFAVFLSLWIAPTFTAAGLALLWYYRPVKDEKNALRARQKLTRPPS